MSHDVYILFLNDSTKREKYQRWREEGIINVAKWWNFLNFLYLFMYGKLIKIKLYTFEKYVKNEYIDGA